MPALLRRAVIAFVALPGTVGFVVPWMLAVSLPQRPSFDARSLPIFCVGTALLLWCVRDFYVTGRGTLAPWCPPRRLVTVGLYRLSRNPMYVAVVIVLTGWAVGFASGALAVYGATVAAAFHARIVLYEEPRLARAFPEEWPAYQARVPRWVWPRRR